jgi:hypothetical protein
MAMRQNTYDSDKTAEAARVKENRKRKIKTSTVNYALRFGKSLCG